MWREREKGESTERVGTEKRKRKKREREGERETREDRARVKRVRREY